MFSYALVALGLAQLALAKTVQYDWDITWVRAAPDGVERPVIGINGEWPCPPIEVDLGDTVIVNMYNALANQSTSLHWHGLHQYGTNEMDGATGITQCPVPPGQSFTYEFMASFASSSGGMSSFFLRRQTDLARTGTIRTTRASTPTVFLVLSSSTILILPSISTRR